MADTTTMEITQEQWAAINGAKARSGDSMKDGLSRILAVYEEAQRQGIEPGTLASENPTTDERDDSSERDVTGAISTAESTHSETEADTDALTGAQRAGIEDGIDVAAQTWDDDERIDQRRDAARAAVFYLFEQGGASKKEVIENVEPGAPVDGQDGRTWYRKTVRPVFNEVAEYNNSEREYQIDV